MTRGNPTPNIGPTPPAPAAFAQIAGTPADQNVPVWSAADGFASWGSQEILVASTTLTSAQLKALHTTPVTLIAAAGGRNYHVIHSYVLHYRFGTIPYDSSDYAFRFAIGYGSALVDLDPATGTGAVLLPLSVSGSPVSQQTLLELTQDAYVVPPFNTGNLSAYAWLASAIENKAISVGITNADGALTTGNGTLTIRLFYSTIDGAP